MDETTRMLIATLLSVGLSRREAAAYVGISHTTIGYAVANDKAFADRVERAEQMAVIKPLITIANVSNNNWKAAVWLLERNEKRRKPTPDEQREAQEEREWCEKETQEWKLRQVRYNNEWFEACRARPEPASPPDYALAVEAMNSDNPTPAAQAELDKFSALVKRKAEELPEDDDEDDWLDDEEE